MRNLSPWEVRFNEIKTNSKKRTSQLAKIDSDRKKRIKNKKTTVRIIKKSGEVIKN